MLDVRLLGEADRQLTVCNACRYCESLCAVFPALERRRSFEQSDIIQLANLCHDCGVCLDVCPYSPPHEFSIDVPRVLTQIRAETYRRYSAPRFLSEAFARGARTATIVTLIAIGVILTLVVALRSDRLFEAIVGPGSFYEVIPWVAMFVPALVVSIYGITILGVAGARFWREADGPLAAKLDARSFSQATADVLLLRQMRGGGPGCSHPVDQRPSHRRIVLHQAIFYGFLLTLVSTTLAAVTQEVLGVLPPYPLLSPIVVAGTVGGILQVVGCSGMMALKIRSPSIPASVTMRQLDFAFLTLLLIVNVTGLGLLALRETAAMGILLVIHLGSVAGLFITMPYGKFVHVIHRYAALVRDRLEQASERSPQDGST